MDQPLILALDQGTTSTRAIVFSMDGVKRAEASRPLAQAYPADGWVEHDPEAIYQASVAVMREAFAACGQPLTDIAALGIANQRETVLVWERDTGRPIHPAIVWQDRRTAGVCEALRANGAEAEVAAITGLVLDPYFSAAKIAWVLDHVDGARARADELLCGTIDTWLVWRLTGGAVHATDATNASRTALFDLRRQDWSPAMLALFDVPAVLLPEVRDTAGDFGEMGAEVLGAPIPIRAVVGDQQGAMMGQGCLSPGSIKATFGTGCFMLMHTGDQPQISKSRLLTTVAARIKGRPTFALEGAVFMAGAALQWLNEGLGVAGGPGGVEALAKQARPDHSVVLVPAFAGLGAPWWDPQARGAILGLTRDSGLPEICAAAYDGCALQTRDLIDAMRADAAGAFAGLTELRIDGGMARSSWFAQRLADLTGLSVCRSDEPEATALGAARFAALGAGLFATAQEAASAAAHGAISRPDPDEQRRDQAYARWLEAVGRLRALSMRP